MSVKDDYKNLANKLVAIYTKQYLQLAKRAPSNLSRYPQLPLFKSMLSMENMIEKYRRDSTGLELVLETIDLETIYSNVELKEKEASKVNDVSKLQYDDYLVQELLRYFKHDFFKWVNKPSCPQCQNDDESKIEGIGTSSFPSNRPNPDQITRIEMYKCLNCNATIQFPRMNNAVSLLTFRKGRCGEWVNCFMLILQALIGGDEDRLRYVWNYEDHVWCEYYSKSLKRWVHLDPCEAVFDEPHLYCNNWGKRMSFVIGYNANYVIDLSDKYITKEKQIDKSSIIPNLTVFKQFITEVNYSKLLYQCKQLQAAQQKGQTEPDEVLLTLYNTTILPLNQELKSLHELQHTPPLPTSPTNSSIPQGRQTGSYEWTKQRGEDGPS